MKVLIQDMDDDSYEYIAASIDDCKDDIDKSVYREVVRFGGDTICMGHIVGSYYKDREIPSVSQEWIDLNCDAYGDCFSDADPGL